MANYVTQAPKMMQDMAPDLAAQQIALQRQQQMADLIRQQGMAAPDRTEMVSGVAVKQSPLIGLSKMLQVYMGGKMQDKADEKSAALGKALSARQIEEFDKLLGGGQAPVQATMGDPEQPGAPLAQAPTADPLASLKAKAKAALLMGNKDLANDLIKNMFTMTDAQRRDRELGIGVPESREAELAKRNKEGTMSFQPGQTNVLPNGQRIVAPNFDTGIAGGFGPDGKPMMQGIQGGNVIAQMAGDKKRAEAAGAAGFDMVTVETPNGPVMMTKEQAARQAGGQQAPQQGGPSNMGFPPGAQVPKPTPGMQGRLEILQQERAKIAALPDTDPRKAMELAAIDREIGGSGKQQMPGITLQTEAEKAAKVDTAKAGVALEKERLAAAQSPEAQQKIIDAKSVVDLLNMAEPHYKSATGSTLGSLRDKAGNVFGQSSKASEAAAQLSVIGGALVAKQPKMSGPQSDKDVELYREMAGKIGDPTVPMGQKIAAAKAIRIINERYADQNKDGVAAKTVNANQSEQKIRRYNPTTGMIE